MKVRLPIPLCWSLTQALNALIKANPDSESVLQGLAGGVVHVTVHSGPEFFLHLHHDVVEIQSRHEGETDLKITGHFDNFRSLLIDRVSVSASGVKLTGDLSLANGLNQLLYSLGDGWQEYVSDRVGDTVAHKLDRTGQALLGWHRQTVQRASEELADFLQR